MWETYRSVFMSYSTDLIVHSILFHLSSITRKVLWYFLCISPQLSSQHRPDKIPLASLSCCCVLRHMSISAFYDIVVRKWDSCLLAFPSGLFSFLCHRDHISEWCIPSFSAVFIPCLSSTMRRSWWVSTRTWRMSQRTSWAWHPSTTCAPTTRRL